MWTIDQLKLTLPPGFEHRAERIARRVARELAELPLPPIPQDISIRSLSLPPIQVRPGASDAHVAGRIARAIAESVNPVAGNRP